MGNRSLIEINHDMSAYIKRDPAGFVADMGAYLSSASPRTADVLMQRYGVRVFGMRHHSEGFELHWGDHRKVIKEPTANTEMTSHKSGEP